MNSIRSGLCWKMNGQKQPAIDGPQAVLWHINEYASALIYCCGKGGAGCCLISLIDPLSEWAC